MKSDRTYGGERPFATSEARLLVEAGIADDVDYDYERGLSRHLAAISALPDLGSTTGTTRPPDAATSGAIGAKATLAAVVLPVAAVAVALSMYLPRARDVAAPQKTGAAGAATAAAPAKGTNPSADVAESAAAVLEPEARRSNPDGENGRPRGAVAMRGRPRQATPGKTVVTAGASHGTPPRAGQSA